MKDIITISEMKETSKMLCKQEKTIGFVPTMGYLHEGHLSLVKEAKKKCDIVVMSVFVNPLQFGINEDLDKYPRDMDRDIYLAKQAGVDYFFTPSVQEMYPKEMVTTLKVSQISDVLCGAKRIGHFDGVATVVMKLLNIVSPKYIYMGIKDAQQVAVINRMIEDFNLDVQVIPVRIMREKNGLAMSSRNKYLTNDELLEAPTLFKVLQQVEQEIHLGMLDVSEIKTYIAKSYEPLNAVIDYIEVLTYPDLSELDRVSGEVIIAVAVIFPNARLIDNIILTISDNN